jgi:HEAT repeat protein
MDLATHSLSAEEREDQRELLLARFGGYGPTSKEVKDEVLDLSEIVTRCDKLVILGDPGSGKTTLLRYLASKHARALQANAAEAARNLGATRFPVFIRIADYAEFGIPIGKSLSDYLSDYCYKHECPNEGLADLLATKLAAGTCLILLDGLDEVVSADERRNVVRQIEEFVRRHSDVPNRFIVTSRNAGYRSAPLGEPFTHYTVQDMDETQIHHFLEHWCTAVEAVQTPDLSMEAREVTARQEIDSVMQAMQNSVGVRRLAVNPLLLCILALIHRTGAQLPQKRVELYRLAADTLAQTWRTSQGVRESALIKEDYLTPLLSKLAYWLHSHKPTGIATEREVYDVLGEEWANLHDLEWNPERPNVKIREETRKFLLAVREHTGLFVERAPKRYGFMHLTFEEYYAARYLVARSKIRATLIRRHLHNSRWDEPILLALSFIGLESRFEAQELVETAILAEGEDARVLGLQPSEYEEQLGRDSLFALRCLGDNIPMRPKVIQRLVEGLVDELLYRNGRGKFSRYQNELMSRVKLLEKSETTSILLPYLLSALHIKDSARRYDAAEILNRLGYTSTEVLDAFITALHSKERMTRLQAAKNLERSGKVLDRASFDRILAAAQEIVALSDVETASPADEIEAILVAGESLGYLGIVSSEIVALLITTLQDNDRRKRMVAVRALGYLDQVSDEAITALMAALSDEGRGITEWSASILGRFGQKSVTVIKTLLLATDSSNARIRHGALESLGWAGQASVEVLQVLLSTLHDDDREMRMTAAWGLGRLGQASAEVVTELIESLHDTYHWVRAEAARSLGWLGQASREIIAALVAALHDGDAQTRDYAMGSLARLEQASPEVVQGLLEVLNSELEEDRYQASVCLGRLGQASPKVISVLFEALSKARSLRVRSDSALLLSNLGHENEGIVNALWSGLRDKRSVVRIACSQGLARIGRRFIHTGERLKNQIVQAITAQDFGEPDEDEGRQFYDFAYDALWLLVVGGNIDIDENLPRP